MDLRRSGQAGMTFVRGALSVCVLLGLAACPKGDVGAPCNHGQVDAPAHELVTFPALSCNDLLCVYADTAEAPKEACTSDQDCNAADPTTARFVCNTETKRCALSNTYVLEKSMCSKKCSSDDDCKDGGPTKKVVAEGTKCQSGFSCVRIQTLGDLCCERMCVCNDDLDRSKVEMNNTACSNATLEGCCVIDGEPVTPLPDACGP